MSLSNLEPAMNALYYRLRHALAQVADTQIAHILHTILRYTFAWRTLFLVLAILNIKNVPFSWHTRLFYGMYRHHRGPDDIRDRVRKAAAALPPFSSSSSAETKPVHPLFRPLTTHTHVPLYECDYNGHKSNSTYFSDLDLSRGNLMASLIGPAMRFNALVPHGVRPGLCYPILGSVHTSFLREIKPYERYGVRSRVLGWDRKWIVIGSVFVRAATAEEIRADDAAGRNFLKLFGEGGDDDSRKEVVFACVLNKYVIKSGRITVPPELCFAGSGWFPVRPEATETIRRYNSAAAAASKAGLSTTGTGTGTPALGPDQSVQQATTAAHNVAVEAGRRLSMGGQFRPKITSLPDRTSDDDVVGNDDEKEEMPGWSWEEIEAERKRGLEVALAWLGLDVELRRQYEDEIERGIW